MGKLEDVERGLYTPDGKGGEPPPFFEVNQDGKSNNGETATNWDEEKSTVDMKKKRTISISRIIPFAVFILGVSAFLFAFYFGFQKEDLLVKVSAKEKIESGERVAYDISYRNQSRTTLHDLELSFTYPDGSEPLQEVGGNAKTPRTRMVLPDLAPGAEAHVDLDARVFGKEGEAKTGEAVILYRHESSSSRFVVNAKARSVVLRVPIVLSVGMPDQLVGGQEVEVTINYSSDAEAAFQNLSLGVLYPNGFDFTSANPAPTSGNSIWSIGALAPGEGGKIAIRGKISGAPSELKLFTARLGVYDATQKAWTSYQTTAKNTKISTPLLAVTQTINGSRDAVARLGSDVSVKVHYQNTLDIPIKNVALEVKLDSDFVDVKTLEADNGGVYNGDTKSLIWNGGSYSQFTSLPAHAEGDVSFHFRLPNTTPSGTKNLTIGSHAIIRSSDTPQGLNGIVLTSEDQVQVKVTSRLILSSDTFFHTDYLATSGSIPPRVGKKTSYVIAWKLSNTLNDLADGEVHATLSPRAAWETAGIPTAGSLSFDPGSGLITWRVGNIPAGAGISQDPKAAVFRVSITPSVDQVGKTPALVSGISASARDAFTNETLTLQAPDNTTQLPNDTTAGQDAWNVKP